MLLAALGGNSLLKGQEQMESHSAINRRTRGIHNVNKGMFGGARAVEARLEVEVHPTAEEEAQGEAEAQTIHSDMEGSLSAVQPRMVCLEI